MVILDKHQCEDMRLQLLNTQWYKYILPLMIEIYIQQYYSILNKAIEKGIITRPMWEHIQTPHPQTPDLYSLLKTHKKTLILGDQ